MSLKTQVDDKFKEIDKAKKDEKSKDDGSEGLSKSDKKSNVVAAASGDVQAVKAKEPSTSKPELKAPIPIGQSAGLGFKRVTTNTNETVSPGVAIDLDAKPNYLMLNYQFTRPWLLNSKWVAMLRFSMGNIMNKLDQELDNSLHVGLYQTYVFDSGIMPFVGIERQNLTFVALPVVGEGLEAGAVDLNMLAFGSYIKLNLFRQDFIFVPEIALGISSSSSYKRLKATDTSSNKISLAIQFMNLVKKINLELNYYQLNFESSGEEPFSANSSGTGLNVFYNF